MKTSFKVDKLTKDFGHGRGIFNVNFEIKKGEVLGFLGPNGAGKSTTIRTLMGFTKPDKGCAKILDLDVTKQSYQLMNKIGYLPGEVNLPENMHVKSFIKSIKQMHHLTDDNYLNYLLTYFDFKPQGLIKRMSLGNKRKLAIIAALMPNPDILILDEPTSGLDPKMQDQFIDLMVKEKQKGKTILLSSHIFKEVEALCDRIIIIKEGKLVSEVDANKLKNSSIKKFEILFKNEDELRYAQNIFKGSVKGNKLLISVRLQDLNAFFKSINNYQIKSLVEKKFDLEKYFLKFYKTNRKFQTI